jgi:hypothetical protein
MQGIGYQEARKKRFSEGFTGSNLESKGNEEYLLYFGRAHINDFETGMPARGYMKVGRGKFKTALQRGRNQPGVDFRIYAEIIVKTNIQTHQIEKLAATMLKDKSIKGSQGQKELYNIKDDELFDIVNDIAEVAKDCYNIDILEFNFYNDNNVSTYKLESASTFEKLFEV